MPLTTALDPLLETAHVIGAVLFVGNVIVTGVWSAIFHRARHSHDFTRAARAIVITDWIFTVGGGALLTTSGVALAMLRGLPLWETGWIRRALIALGISTLLWLVVLVPAQRTMVRTELPDAVRVRAYTRWNLVGWLATVPLVYAVWCMAGKPS